MYSISIPSAFALLRISVSILFLAICFTKVSWAQIAAPAETAESQSAIARIDLELDNLNNNMAQVFTADRHAVFLYATKITEKGLRQWELIEIDKDLKLVRRLSLWCMKDVTATARAIETHGNQVITFVVTLPTTGRKDGTNIISYDPKTGEAKNTTFDESAFERIKRFIRVGNDVFVTGHDRTGQPLVVVYDVTSAKVNAVNIGTGYVSGTVTDAFYMPKAGHLVFALHEHRDNHLKDVRLVAIDKGFNLVANSRMNVQDLTDRWFEDLHLVEHNSGFVLAGKYNMTTSAFKSAAFVNTVPSNEGSAGMFLAELGPKYEVNTLRLYNLKILEGYDRQWKAAHAFLPDKNVAKAEAAGEEPDVDQRILVHEPEYVNGKWIMHAEAYFFHDMAPYLYGYQPVGFITFAVDKEGRKLWDLMQPIQSTISPFLQPQTRIVNTGSECKILFRFSGELRVMDLMDPKRRIGIVEVTEGDNPEPTKVEVINTITKETRHWYDNNSLRFGYQKIRVPKDQQRKDLVFFIEKL